MSVTIRIMLVLEVFTCGEAVSGKTDSWVVVSLLVFVPDLKV